MIVGQHSFAHQTVSNGQAHVLDELAEFGRRVGQDHPTTGVEQRPLGTCEHPDDALGDDFIKRWLVQRLRVMRKFLEQGGVDLLRKDVHRHRDEYGTRTSFFGQLKGLLQDLGKQIRSVHAPYPLDERPIDFGLCRVSVQIDFLVRMLAVVVARNIARDDDHRNGIERRVGDPS